MPDSLQIFWCRHIINCTFIWQNHSICLHFGHIPVFEMLPVLGKGCGCFRIHWGQAQRFFSWKSEGGVMTERQPACQPADLPLRFEAACPLMLLTNRNWHQVQSWGSFPSNIGGSKKVSAVVAMLAGYELWKQMYPEMLTTHFLKSLNSQ